MIDPRHCLEPGVYRARVTRHSEPLTDYPPATDDRTALIGAMIGLAHKDTMERAWIDYTIPGCGDWVWRLYGRDTSPEFIEKAIERGWFEWEKRAEGRDEPTRDY